MIEQSPELYELYISKFYQINTSSIVSVNYKVYDGFNKYYRFNFNKNKDFKQIEINKFQMGVIESFKYESNKCNFFTNHINMLEKNNDNNYITTSCGFNNVLYNTNNNINNNKILIPADIKNYTVVIVDTIKYFLNKCSNLYLHNDHKDDKFLLEKKIIYNHLYINTYEYVIVWYKFIELKNEVIEFVNKFETIYLLEELSSDQILDMYTKLIFLYNNQFPSSNIMNKLPKVDDK